MEFDLSQYSEKEQEWFRKRITEWKHQYDGSVYVTEINDIPFIWRGLTRGEFKKANEYYEDDFERADFVCECCVLYPEVEDFSTDMYGGVPETLTEQILKASGYTSGLKEIDAIIAEYEKEMLRFDNQVTLIIKEAFPEIKLEDIDGWQFEKVMKYYAMAKWTLETLRGLNLEREDVEPGAMPQ